MVSPSRPLRLIRFSGFALEPQTRTLFRDGQKVVLPPQPFQLLQAFLDHPGEVVTREELVRALWPTGTFVDFDQGLKKAVGRLRDLLNDSAENSQIIETLPRQGYRFIAEVVLPSEVTPAIEDGKERTPLVVKDSGQERFLELGEPVHDEDAIRETNHGPVHPAENLQETLSNGPLVHRAQQKMIGFTASTASGSKEPIAIVARSWKRSLIGGAAILFAALVLIIFWNYRYSANPPQRLAYEVVPLTSLPGEETSPTFSPDGSQVAFGWNGETQGSGFDLYVKVIGTDKPLRLTNHPAPMLSAAWSPDGRSIAFRRIDLHTENGGIFLLSALGGPEKKLASTNDQFISRAPLSWSPDGKRLAFADHAESSGALSTKLYVLSLDTLERREIETSCIHAYAPSFSPNGRIVAYACGQDVGRASLNLTELATSRQRQLFSGPWIAGLAWSRDGERIIFSVNFPSASGANLWQIRVTGDTPVETIGTVHDSLSPAISSQGDRLAYVETHINIGVWKADLGGRKLRNYALAPSTRRQFDPVISPDDRRVAFVSNRSGASNLWVCDRDGDNLRQLSSFSEGVTGSPQWSADGKQIAFDSRITGEPNVYVVDVDGGVPRKLETGTSSNSLPSWSHDGKWIYFSSGVDISSLSIWRAPAVGGKASQLIKSPSLKPIESPDGKQLYFVRTTADKGRLWRSLLDGSNQEMLEMIPPLADAHQWWPSKTGIYFWTYPKDKPEVDFLDLRTAQIHRVYVPDQLSSPNLAGLSVSSAGDWLVYSRVDERSEDLMLLDNFR